MFDGNVVGTSISVFLMKCFKPFSQYSKAIARQDTAGWDIGCHKKPSNIGSCRIGFPWPEGAEEAGSYHNKDGFKYNCYVNSKVETYWGPLLRSKLKERGFLEESTQ